MTTIEEQVKLAEAAAFSIAPGVTEAKNSALTRVARNLDENRDEIRRIVEGEELETLFSGRRD